MHNKNYHRESTLDNEEYMKINFIDIDAIIDR